MRSMLRLPVLASLACLMMGGCNSVYSVSRADPEALANEGSIVFVRPKHYASLGTLSLRDYVEVVGESAGRNTAGLLVVRVGLRDRGGQHFWDTHGPNFNLSVKTVFYDQPLATRGLPVYETNWEPVRMLRGATAPYEAICPVKNGAYYQVVISESL